MSSARDQGDLYERLAPARGNHTVVERRFTHALTHALDDEGLVLLLVTEEKIRQRAACLGRNAVRHGIVALFQPVALHLGAERRSGVAVLGVDHQPARLTVKPMHGVGFRLFAVLGKVPVEQRKHTLALARLAEQPRRLQADRYAGILKYNCRRVLHASRSS